MMRPGWFCVPWGMSSGFWMRSGWAVACVVAMGGGVVRADDWPQWRGLRRDGTSAEKGWKVEWPASGPKVAWKAQVGLGFSSVVVADGGAYTVSISDGENVEESVSAIVEVELEATTWTLVPGRTLRVAIAGTDWPNCWPSAGAFNPLA